MVRLKNRHIVFEIVFHGVHRQKAVREQDVYYAVRNALQDTHGDYGVGCLLRSLSVKYLSADTNIVYLRTGRGVHKMVQTAILFIKEIGEQPAFLRTLHVAGSIRSCSKFLIQYHKDQLPKLLSRCITKEEKQKVQAAIVSSCTAFRKKLGIEDRHSAEAEDG